MNQFVAHVAQTVMESTIGTEWINRRVTSPLAESSANKKFKKKKKKKQREETKREKTRVEWRMKKGRRVTKES